MYKTLQNGTKLHIPLTKSQLFNLRMQRASRHLIVCRKPAVAPTIVSDKHFEEGITFCVSYNRTSYVFYMSTQGWVCPVTGRIIVTPGFPASTCPNIKQGVFSATAGNVLYYYVQHYLHSGN